jgi:cyclopropane fatty-acyl-phospholipid synthase-like methyltransferase
MSNKSSQELRRVDGWGRISCILRLGVNMHRLLWNVAYLFGRTPWDTGITPPELHAVVESGRVQPGRALDLGCGTGTNVLYLAQHGFDTVGVDISSRAIAAARRKIKRAGLAQRAHVYTGDVTRLDTLPVTGLFNLVLDLGCLHILDEQGRARYATELAAHTQTGGLYLLYAFGPRACLSRCMGLTTQEVEQLFTPAFTLLRVNHGQDRGGVESAWYTFERRET